MIRPWRTTPDSAASGWINAGYAGWDSLGSSEIPVEGGFQLRKRPGDQDHHEGRDQPLRSLKRSLRLLDIGTSKRVLGVQEPAAVLLRCARRIPSGDPMVPGYMPAFGFVAMRASSNRSAA